MTSTLRAINLYSPQCIANSYAMYVAIYHAILFGNESEMGANIRSSTMLEEAVACGEDHQLCFITRALTVSYRTLKNRSKTFHQASFPRDSHGRRESVIVHVHNIIFLPDCSPTCLRCHECAHYSIRYKISSMFSPDLSFDAILGFSVAVLLFFFLPFSNAERDVLFLSFSALHTCASSNFYRKLF